MKNITVQELFDLGEVPIVDVRERHEYAGGHVPGAINVPLSEFLDRVAEVPKGSDVYIICASGGRSVQATTYLESLSYPAVNVLDGTYGWQAAGLPLTREA